MVAFVKPFGLTQVPYFGGDWNIIHTRGKLLSKAEHSKRGQTRCFKGAKGLGGDWQSRWPRKDGSVVDFEKVLG